MSTVSVGIRFERDVWARHSAAAQVRGLPLGAYLRQLIDEQERVATALDELRAAVERGVGEKRERVLEAAVLEILLILRASAVPQNALMAQKEVGQRGFEPWR
jgi:predicted DNA-binding ribbon-helix-helix protein